MDYASLAVLVGAVLTLASVMFGEKYQQSKGKVKQLAALLNTVIEAAQEDKATDSNFKIP